MQTTAVDKIKYPNKNKKREEVSWSRLSCAEKGESIFVAAPKRIRTNLLSALSQRDPTPYAFKKEKAQPKSRRQSKYSKVVPCALSRQRFALSIGRLELFGVVRSSLGSLGRPRNIGMKMSIFRQSSRVLPG